MGRKVPTLDLLCVIQATLGSDARTLPWHCDMRGSFCIRLREKQLASGQFHSLGWCSTFRAEECGPSASHLCGVLGWI